MKMGVQAVLRQGVAGRLHIDPKLVQVSFAASTYAGAPKGIDESAAVIVKVGDKYAKVSWRYAQGLSTTQLADRIIEVLA